MAVARELRLWGMTPIGEGIAFAGVALAVGVVLGALLIRDGLQAYACGSNPYLTFCTEWVDDERSR